MFINSITLLALDTPAISSRQPLQHRPLLALFFKCSRLNSHRQTYNARSFNAIPRKITSFRADKIGANKVNRTMGKIKNVRKKAHDQEGTD